jgi:hypothetical protein
MEETKLSEHYVIKQEKFSRVRIEKYVAIESNSTRFFNNLSFSDNLNDVLFDDTITSTPRKNSTSSFNNNTQMLSNQNGQTRPDNYNRNHPYKKPNGNKQNNNNRTMSFMQNNSTSNTTGQVPSTPHNNAYNFRANNTPVTQNNNNGNNNARRSNYNNKSQIANVPNTSQTQPSPMPRINTINHPQQQQPQRQQIILT